MYLGDGQCCGEKEKDGVAKDDRPWGAALGGEGQTRLSRSLRGWRELAQARRMATRTVGRESQCAIDLRSQGHVPL